ncbi:MAG: hypothetical protein AB1758_11110, partial [Candidatus Eremiobacterota bacterium]
QPPPGYPPQPAAQPAPAPAQPPPPQPARPGALGRGAQPLPTAPPPGQLHTPPPLLFVDLARVPAIREQVLEPPDSVKLPWTPLPRVDPDAVSRAVDAAEKRKLASDASKQTGPIRSAFGDQQSSFTGGSMFGQGGTPGGQQAPPPRFGAPESAPKPGASGRTGNQSLADAIARKLQQNQGK